MTVIRRVQLFAPDQVEEIERELVPHFEDPQALAEHLVQIEWLTDYQRETLFAGEWDMLSVGPYTLLGRLGTGGVSEVYKAWDTVNGRLVALKVMRRNLPSPADAARQFQRELEALPRLGHPNVIRTFVAHHHGDLHYFAQEYVEGTDLARYVRQHGPLPVDQACDYVRQVAQGLQHAHQYGLVHRDIKPANLFLVNPPLPVPAGAARRGPDPLVKFIDWGLARIRSTPGGPPGARPPGSLSGGGALIGTADYVSPEQARDASVVDTRSDIYSLGCTFAYLLTGQPPFPGKSLMEKLMRHQQGPPPPLSALRPDVPEELEQIVHKMMAKDPAERFQIPLLVVAPLRKFGPGGAAGSVIRPPGSGLRPIVRGANKPSTEIGMGRPETQLAIQPPSANSTPRPPGANGVHKP